MQDTVCQKIFVSQHQRKRADGAVQTGRAQHAPLRELNRDDCEPTLVSSCKQRPGHTAPRGFSCT